MGQEFHRGDIVHVRDVPFSGSEQCGGRPAVVVGNDTGNRFAPVLEVVYMTTRRKRKMPTHVRIFSAHRPSTVMCEQIQTVSKQRITDKWGRVTPAELEKIDRALRISLGLSGNQRGRQ